MKEVEKCECGEEQDADHLFACPLLPIKCRKEDFMTTTDISDKAIQIAAYWKGKGIRRPTRKEKEEEDRLHTVCPSSA